MVTAKETRELHLMQNYPSDILFLSVFGMSTGALAPWPEHLCRESGYS